MADFYAKYVGGSGGGGGGSGDVIGPASSDDNGLVLFDGISGKIIKEASGTGFVKVTSGVMGVPSATVSLTSEVAGILPVANGGTNSNTALNNNRVMRSTGGAVTEASAITAARALISDANGIPTHSATTATELGYVNGVTSSIQAQLDAKEPDITPGSISTTTSGMTVGSGANSTVGPNVTVNVQNATGAQPGLLTAADWTTFNSKQAGDATLTALAAYNTDGLMTQTAADTFTGRTLTGTANRITVTNGNGVAGNPTADISTSYVGQNTITTLGTITTGTWTGTTIAIANGGTGQTAKAAAFDALSPATTKGDIIAYSTTGDRLGVGANGTVLTAASGQTTGLQWIAPAPIIATSMTDVQATALGYKAYYHGTTYNGGIAPTISASGWTIIRGACTPYQKQDGTWWMRFNFSSTHAGNAGTTVTINGVTFKNVANYRQGCGASTNSAVAIFMCVTDPNASTIAVNISVSVTQMNMWGEVELESKPTWAY